MCQIFLELVLVQHFHRVHTDGLHSIEKTFSYTELKEKLTPAILLFLKIAKTLLQENAIKIHNSSLFYIKESLVIATISIENCVYIYL